ncbi:TSC complex subunit tuberin isoform X2 [Oratosquilla oratoria]|uniref:TSC complex subunit tuberin isoform X2 n=1 Tax=Oratosquilla oratoria TaxID=337810 RepID=UPI003F75A4A0
MSKDGKDRNIVEVLKKWFKNKDAVASPAHEILLSKERRMELGADAPMATRMQAIRNLTEELATKKAEDSVIALWSCVEDLLVLNVRPEYRHTTLNMLTTLCHSTSHLAVARPVFFQHITTNYEREEVEPMFEFFRGVTGEGRYLEYIEEDVGPFLLKWLPAILATPQSKKALNLITNLIKFNAAYMDEPVVVGFVKQAVMQLNRVNGEVEAMLSLQVLDAVLAYSYLPSAALPTFITALTRAVNAPALTAMSWKILRNLLGTHLGNSGVYVLCRLIQEGSDPIMIRGAVYFLASALWGNNKVSGINYKPASVLPTLFEAAQHSHILVVYEVAFSIYKLVSKVSLELYLPSWDLVLDILSELFHHLSSYGDSSEGLTIQGVLNDILDVIEQLIDLQQFGGSAEKFFNLVDLYSSVRPESSVQHMLDHNAKILDPLRPHWLANLATLLHRYYKNESRPNIRTKSLAILSDVYRNNRLLYGEEIVEVILIPLEDLENEKDVGVRTAAVNLLVHMAATLNSETTVLLILSTLEKVVVAPYKFGSETHVVRQSEALDIIAAVAGLIRIFKLKLHVLPSTQAIQAYKILLSCLDHHYENIPVLEKVNRIRYQIFEMIFEMRANHRYQLGFPQVLSEEEKSNIKNKTVDAFEAQASSHISNFTPYLVVDHKHGQQLHKVTKEITEQLTQSPPSTNEGGNTEEPVKNEKDNSAVKVEVTHISLTKAAMVVIIALRKEKDWEVLKLILEQVPQVLWNKALILSQNGNDVDYFAAALCDLVSDKSLDLPESLHNTPTKLTKTEFQSFVFPVLAALASYHMHLEPRIQQKLIKCLQMGIMGRTSSMCVSALTLCVLEMRDTMVKLLRGVMLNLSKISATVQNAQPILEFLSTLIHLPKLYANFVSDQYMSIFAIAIPYTNPFKFNHYIVSLAYHVIAMWFLKCRLPLRKLFVPFISKNLNIILTNEEAAFRKRSSSVNEQAILCGRARVTRSVSFSHKRLEEVKLSSTRSYDLEETTKCFSRSKGDVEMMQFHNDLRETCVDLMARYTFANSTPLPKRSAVAEILVSGGHQQTWLVGNKLITITTSGCTQRPLRQGLCDKCLHLCNKDKVASQPERSAGDSSSMYRRRHKSELHRTISHEAKFKPQSKDDLHMRTLRRKSSDSEMTPFVDQGAGMQANEYSDNVEGEQPQDKQFDGAGFPEEKREEPHLCACWCQSWAEIYVRQPTGNTSWMMRVQNHITGQVNPDTLPLHDISEFYAPVSLPSSMDFGISSSIMHKRIDSESMETENYEEMFAKPMEPRPRAFSGTSSDNTSSSKRDSIGSTVPSGGSSDPRLHFIDMEEEIREKSPLSPLKDSGSVEGVPVQRCHSSPEMSEGANAEAMNGNEKNGNLSSSSSEEVRRESVSTRTSTPPHEDTKEKITGGLSNTTPTSMGSNVSTRGKARPRFDGLSNSGSSGSVNLGNSSPPPPLVSSPPPPSTRIRHASALQMRSSGNSITPPGSAVPKDEDITDPIDGSPKPMRRGRGHTISDMNPASRMPIMRSQSSAAKTPATNNDNSSSNNTSNATSGANKESRSNISPSFVFLQLYYHGCLGGGKERPILLKTSKPEVSRSLKILDLIQPQETHKIGVLYAGPGQFTELAILKNTCGSLRYTRFLQGLGTIHELSKVKPESVFLGGLDTTGRDGKLVYVWHDDMMQVVYHIATLMPTLESDPNCNDRKKHIGNNHVTIVYNESGQPYKINTMKGQFNHSVIEVVPSDHATNAVEVLCKREVSEYIGEGHPRLVSDVNLPIVVRQLALHANLASVISESLKGPIHNPYASNWLERLRKIRKIREQLVGDGDSQQTGLLDFSDMID